MSCPSQRVPASTLHEGRPVVYAPNTVDIILNVHSVLGITADLYLVALPVRVI